MKGIKVVSKLQHHILFETQEPTLKVNEDAVIIVKLSLNDIRDIWRHDQQLVIEYKQQKIMINDFFQGSHAQDLILKDPIHGLFLAQVFEAENEKHSEIKFVKIDAYTSLLYSDEIDTVDLSSGSNSTQEMTRQTVFNMSKALAVVGDESNIKEIKSLAVESDNLYSILDILNAIPQIEDKDLIQQGMNLTTILSVDELLSDYPDLINVETQNWQSSPSTELQQDIHLLSTQGNVIDLMYPYTTLI